jgi:hypothetical protein
LIDARLVEHASHPAPQEWETIGQPIGRAMERAPLRAV